MMYRMNKPALAMEYYNRVLAGLEAIKNTQMDAILKVADEVASRLEKGGILYVFGSGHSHVLAEEVYARAGGLFQARAIMPPELIDFNMDKSTLMERTDGLADVIFATHNIRSCDALVVASNSGRNTVPVQFAQLAKSKGIYTVALTNMAHSKGVTSRDKSGKKLYEVCDIALDTCGTYGDAIVPVPGRDYSIAPASTILGAMVVELLVCSIVESMISRGFEPPVMRSSNLDGTDDINRRAKEELKERFPGLRDAFSVF